MEILIKAQSRCHKDHHKGKKEAFSVVIREAPIFPNDCMENSEICLVRLARSISVVFDLISLCIERHPVLLLYTHVWMKVKHCHKCLTFIHTWVYNSNTGRLSMHKDPCSPSIPYKEGISKAEFVNYSCRSTEYLGKRDQFHKSQNAPVPYPTMLHSEQKCAHFCSEWSIVGYGNGTFWVYILGHP